jgi:hypothetical protein
LCPGIAPKARSSRSASHLEAAPEKKAKLSPEATPGARAASPLGERNKSNGRSSHLADFATPRQGFSHRKSTVHAALSEEFFIGKLQKFFILTV